jgi:hypothetical protein
MLKRLKDAGERERARMGAGDSALSPWRVLGAWFGFLRPSRLLMLLGATMLVLGIVYVLEFRAARDGAVAEAGANATPARIEALTIERLALTRCAGLSRSCGVLPGKQSLYANFGAYGTAAIFGIAAIGFFVAGVGLVLLRARRSA